MSNIDLLASKDVHERADVGRQLSRVGLPEHIDRLLTHAFTDKSPGVRLYTIGAVADILSRYRVGAAAEALDTARREAILADLHGIDPGVNAGMFSVLACLGLPRVARRILVGLQDPRLDVRTGACVGIYRYCISHAAADDADIRERIYALMGGRLRPDASAALARLCAQCGWQDSRQVLEGLLGREDQTTEAAEQALAQLDRMDDWASFGGLWFSWKADAGEIRPLDAPRSWMLVSMDQGLKLQGKGKIKTGRITGNGAKLRGKPLRRMWLPVPPDHEPRLALQHRAVTWYQATPKETVERLGELLAEEAFDAASLAPFSSAIAEQLPKGAPGALLAARIELASGNAEVAKARLEALIAAKKPPVEALFYLAQSHRALGEGDAADQAQAAFLKKAPKRHPLRALAEQG